jgi:hypothetical protein
MAQSKTEIEAKRILENPLIKRNKVFELAGVQKMVYWNHRTKGTSVPDDYWQACINAFKNNTKEIRSI